MRHKPWTVALVFASFALGTAGLLHHLQGAHQASIPWPATSAEMPPALRSALCAAREKALQWPAKPGAAEKLAMLYWSNGFEEEAGLLFEQLLARHTDDPVWLHRLAVARSRRGLLPEALALWERSAAQTQNPLAVRIKWADALVKSNRLPDAEKLYRAVLTTYPDHPYAVYGLARLAMQKENWAAAKSLLTGSLAKEPDFYGNHALLQAVARHEGDEALAQAEDAEIKRMGRFRNIADPWTDPKLEDSFDPTLVRINGDLHFSQREWEEAGRWYARATELEPSDSGAWLWLGAAWAQRGDMQQAKAAYRRALETDPHQTRGYYWLARVLQSEGDTAGADAVLETGLNAVPSEGGFLIAVGRSRGSAGRWLEAADLLARALAINPDDPNLAVELATAHFRAGRESQGVDVLRNNRLRHPEHLRTLALLTVYAIRSGDETGALDLFESIRKVPEAKAMRNSLEEQFRSRFGRFP